MSVVYITHAKRSPVGNFGGALSSLSPAELAAQVLQKIIAETPDLKCNTDLVIAGNVLAAGHGQNIARQVALKSGLDLSVPAYTLNQVCGSGLQAIVAGKQAIQAGDADIVIALGTEVMSQAAHVLKKHRWGHKLGHESLVDTLVHDGLWDAFNDVHMGITAETIAMQEFISREDQDRFALESHKRASKAAKAGKFDDEIVPISVVSRKQTLDVTSDESIRHDASLEGLTRLKPVFDGEGSITAGNASSINDGAAVVILMSEKAASQYADKNPLVRIACSSTVANNPKIMGMAPCKGVRSLLEKAQLSFDDIDFFEINEAFAAQTLAVQRKLELSIEKMNVNGGAIALGHPIGASGTRLAVSAFYQLLSKTENKRAVLSLCVGGGQAVSVLLEKN